MENKKEHTKMVLNDVAKSNDGKYIRRVICHSWMRKKITWNDVDDVQCSNCSFYAGVVSNDYYVSIDSMVLTFFLHYHSSSLVLYTLKASAIVFVPLFFFCFHKIGFDWIKMYHFYSFSIKFLFVRTNCYSSLFMILLSSSLLMIRKNIHFLDRCFLLFACLKS